MNRKIYLLVLLFCAATVYGQLGLKLGVNRASEVKVFDQNAAVEGFNSNNLIGYQVGLVYQAMPKKSGFGCEFAVLLSQKGSSFNDTTTVAGAIKQGYTELNYIETPVNIRYQLMLGFIGIYGTAGIYGAYALSGQTTNETTNEVLNTSYSSLVDKLDYGYNLGAGIELFKKIQLGANWSQGLKNTSSSIVGLPFANNVTNRVFTMSLVYLF